MSGVILVVDVEMKIRTMGGGIMLTLMGIKPLICMKNHFQFRELDGPFGDHFPNTWILHQVGRIVTDALIVERLLNLAGTAFKCILDS